MDKQSKSSTQSYMNFNGKKEEVDNFMYSIIFTSLKVKSNNIYKYESNELCVPRHPKNLSKNFKEAKNLIPSNINDCFYYITI